MDKIQIKVFNDTLVQYDDAFALFFPVIDLKLLAIFRSNSNISKHINCDT